MITEPGGRSSSSPAGDNNNNNSRAEGSSHRRRQSSGSVAEDIDPWPHHHSGLMASLSLTVTVFNISRFAVLGAAFGWPFLVQWILVSLVLGLPLLTLHAALGQHTGLGPLQLWRVAPIFQGVGVSLVVAQAVLGVYCSVPVAWLFVYFRDSFISHKSAFTWSSCWKVPGMNCTGDMNLSQILPQSIPSYLSWQVQHRTVGATWEESLGSINFNLAFYVPLIWLVTLLVLCKGNRVYGRLSYVLFIVPLLCFLAVCIYVASWTRDDLSLVPDFARAFMNSRSWVAASREVFLVWGMHGPALQQMTVHNRRGQSVKGHIWLVVVTTVLVLVLAAVTGSCCAASFSHVGLKYSPSSFETPESAQFLVPLHDSSSIESTDPVQSGIRTSSNALAPHAGVWGDITSPRFAREGRNVDDGIPDLYERMILLASQLMDSYLRYDSLYAGIRISYPQFGNHHSRLFNGMRRLDPDHPALGPVKRPLGGLWTTPRPARSESPPDPSRSGYQALRLATELFPAFLGVHGVDKIQTFWPFLFYLSLLLFGIGQQVAVWRCVVEVVISSAGLQKRRVLATACCCLLGLSASLPLTTQLGPDLLFFLDYVIGCGWWLMILQLVQVFSLLFVRGKPVSAQDLVSSVGGTRQGSGVPGWSVHVAAFACSILVPVGLLVLAISSFKSGHYREVFAWSSPGYWPVWASQLASALQLLPILLVPVVALAQTCRYLAKTRYDVFLRIQLLYRPAFNPRMTYPRPPTPPLTPSREDGEAREGDPAYISPTTNSPLPFSDPPPKYTPPPSYSTATGMGIAKALNQSVRRSIRHIRSSLRLSEYPVLPSSAPQSSNATANSPVSHSGVWTTTQEPYIPPVDYIADPSSVQDPYIPPADYVAETIESAAPPSTQDPPPLYSTLDPVARKKVLKVLQRAGIRRSNSQRQRSGGGGRNRDPEEGALVSPPQTTLELQGMDHLAYEHEMVAVWRCVVEVVISSAGLQKRRVLATACCCLLGLSASLPLTTQLGPDLLFFLDYVIGCGWWLMILQLVQVFSLLFVRGKPVSAQDLVSSVGGTRQGSGVPGWSVHVAAFACSILVPVGLLVLAISSFKSGHYREVFAWSSPGYWPVWASQLASALQLLPILLVPVVALAQTCRYLAKTRYDVFLRIQLLYRPAFNPRMTYPRPPTPPLTPSREDGEAREGDPAYISPSTNSPLPFSDPPPKYTPPPSYSTATGMGIAKALNQSVRRSIRHIRSSLRLSEYPVLPSSAPQSSNATANSPVSHSGVWTTTQEPYIPPVDYIADPSSVQDPYIPPADYVAETIESAAPPSTQDPPPLYSTLDPVARKKVLKVLQRAGIRRSNSQRQRSGGGGRNRDPEEGALVSPPQTTLELQGMDHLAYEHEMV